MKPQCVFPVFEEILLLLEQSGELEALRSFGEPLLVAMDGVKYFSSYSIHCPECSTQTDKDGTVRYFYGVVTPVIVSPGRSTVVPMVPEFIVPHRWDGQSGL